MSQKPNLSVNTAQLRARLQQISSNSAKNSDGSERPTMRNRIGTKKIDEDALARVRQLASRVAKSKQENSTEKLPKTAESVELTSSHNISRDKTLPSGQKPSKNTNDSKSNSRRPSVENISKRVNNNISSRNPSDEDLTFREKGLPPPPGKDNVNDISRDKTLPSSRKVSKDDIRVKNNSRKASKDDNRIQPRSRKPSKDNNDDAGMNKLETAMKTLGTTREQSSKNVQELELEIIHLQETLDRRETRWKRDKANYQELLQKSKDENNRLIKDLESLRDQLDNTSEIDKLKQSLELAQENESLACAERDEMKTKYDFDTARLKKDIDELMDNVDSIELQKNAEIRDLTLQVQEMASKNGEYEIDLSKKSQIITELEEDLVKERQELENSKLEHR